MVKPSHFILTPERQPRALNVAGTQVTVLAATAETQSYGMTLQRVTRARGLLYTATIGMKRSTC